MSSSEVEKVAAWKLSPQQKIGAAMVAAGRTDSEIATEVGVAVSTVATWRKRPVFQVEVNRIIGELQKGIVRRAYAAVPKAMEYLVSVLDDPTASHPQRIQAAKVLIDRFPAFTPDLAAEPTPDAVAPTTPRPELPPATVLEIVQVMRDIENARKRHPAPASRYDDDEEQDDDERIVVGSVVEDDEDQPQPVPAKAVPQPAPVAPVRQLTRRPKARTTDTDEAELHRMLRERGGMGGGLRGGGF